MSVAKLLALSLVVTVVADSQSVDTGACESSEADCTADDPSLLQVRDDGWKPLPIYVLTDMGFDDWGAFSILHASGNDPEKVLAVSGMMEPSNFATDFSRLLKSWGIKSPVYKSDDGCHHNCFNTKFIDTVWHYRDAIHKYYEDSLGNGFGSSVKEGSFPWPEPEHFQCKKKYKLLILSPVSQFDFALWEKICRAKCIEEVVLSGGFFGYTKSGRQMSQVDVNTWIQLIPLNAGSFGEYNEEALNAQFDGPPAGGSDESNLRELNVVSDTLAASRSLKSAVDEGVKFTIIPIEVESINRYGQQMLMRQSLPYNATMQAGITDKFITERLCTHNGKNVKPSNPAGGMLQRLACINEAGDRSQYTLDMDAIVATYFWKPNLFKFANKLVAIDSTFGITYSNCQLVTGRKEKGCTCEGTSDVLDCSWTKVAVDFDAISWFDLLENELLYSS